MPALESKFKKAAEEAKQLLKRPGDDMPLKLYAFYKQATEGDVKGKRPGMLDFVGQAKYDAWAKLKGASKDKAMQAYVDLVEKLKSS
jgi:diazepam-binding inhibitor (GABA receptor modulating acyl-CoA-binding protein)